MHNWEKTLQRFRDLGGIVENVVLGEGSAGRGLFPQDAEQPIKISIPGNLLCNAEWLQIDSQGNLQLSGDCKWNDETKSFYLDYQFDYGIGGELQQELLRQQAELFALPESLKTMMISYGVDKAIFQKPSPQACLDSYKKSREMVHEGKLVLMPIVELANHDEQSNKSFDRMPKLGISGKFKNEILINYDIIADAALMFEYYRFSVPKPFSLCGSIAINLGQKTINISRYITISDKMGNTRVPKLNVDGDAIHLSFLELGNINDKGLPKKVFVKLMDRVGMPAVIASNTFETIVEQNKSFFLHLLEEVKPLDGEIVERLRTMAKNQLIPLGTNI